MSRIDRLRGSTGWRRIARLLLAVAALGGRPLQALEEGLASWYAGKFQGRRTASGEIYDAGELTAAHRSLPFGTRVRVLNLVNGREVIVRINDRGPFVEGRVIDLSRAAAEALGMTGSGVAPVRLEPLEDASQAAHYTVQVAAFADPERASAAVRRLAAEGLAATAEPGPDGLVRVKVRGTPESELGHVREAAARAGFAQVLVRREP